MNFLGQRSLMEEVISKKKALYESLLDYAQSQVKFAVTKNLQKFTELVEKRRECIVKIKKNEVLLNRYLANQGGKEVSPQSWKRLKELNKTLLSIVAKIKEYDELNKEYLLQEQTEVHTKLKTIQKGKKGAVKYIGAPQVISGCYTDSKR